MGPPVQQPQVQDQQSDNEAAEAQPDGKAVLAH